MYKHLTKKDIQRNLQVPMDYQVDAIIASGTNPKAKEYIHLYEALEKLGVNYAEEKIEEVFFSDVKIFLIENHRIWFDVVYGTTYLNEFVHWGSMLGSKANLLLGTCGALQNNMKATDTVIPTSSYGNESSTRMYQPDNFSNMHNSDPLLSEALIKQIRHRETIHRGELMTVQAMLAETEKDIISWNAQGYLGVDMESATMFAVSNHFDIPSAALLFVVDNLIEKQLVTDVSFDLLKTQRTSIRKENYEIGIKTILDFLII